MFIARWGARGRLPGQLQRPTGLAITREGLVAVSDYENKCVSLFDLDGKYRNRIGAGKLLGPKGLAITKQGDLVVVDNKGSSVVIFSSEGKIKTKFGTRGSDLPQFAGPHFVAINSHENIIVTDFHNHSVKVTRHTLITELHDVCSKVFTSEGKFIYSFGSKGEGNGQFNGPTGVAVDTMNNIIVADWGNSRLQVG